MKRYLLPLQCTLSLGPSCLAGAATTAPPPAANAFDAFTCTSRKFSPYGKLQLSVLLDAASLDKYAAQKSAPLRGAAKLAAEKQARLDAIRIAQPLQIKAYFDYHKIFMGSLILVPVVGQNKYVQAALIAHQLEFDRHQADVIFWDRNRGPDESFLPLIRREVAAPNYDPLALGLLSKIQPAEARPIVVADILSPQRHYVRDFRLDHGYLAYLSLPDSPLPELTAYLKDKLHHLNSPNDPDEIYALLDRYGSADLLPQVIANYKPWAGEIGGMLVENTLRFWVKWDPKSGLAELRHEMKSPQVGGHSLMGYFVFKGRWSGLAQQFTLENLTSTDLQTVASAISALTQHGDASTAAPVVTRYLQLCEAAKTEPAAAKIIAENWSNPSSGARFLLDKKDWSLSPDQTRQLREIAALEN